MGMTLRRFYVSWCGRGICFQVTRKELYEKYKSLWQTLSDSKKLRYIKMAIEAKKKYDVRSTFVYFPLEKNFAELNASWNSHAIIDSRSFFAAATLCGTPHWKQFICHLCCSLESSEDGTVYTFIYRQTLANNYTNPLWLAVFLFIFRDVEVILTIHEINVNSN